MSTTTAETTARWIERASDWMNAILVKETRQALKSRQFVITFMLLLAASWFMAVFGMVMAGDDIEFGSVGRNFFYVFYFILSVATVLIVPFGAFRSLQAERDLNTFELLNITTLSPRQIVWGKLLSALVQLFIFYSAITPFIAISSLLPGFDAPTAAFILIASMLASLMYSMTALMLSSMAKKRVTQGFFSVLVLGGLAMSLMTGNGQVLWMMQTGGIPLSDPDFWWGIGFLLPAAASYFVLFQQITTAQLTFESDNRSTGIRATCAAQFWLLWICYLGYHWIQKIYPDDDVLMATAFFSGAHWALSGLFFTSEEDSLSRRIRRDLWRNRFLRGLMVPLLPGGARGFLFVLIQLAALWLLVTGTAAFVVAGKSGESWFNSLQSVLSVHQTDYSRVVLVTTAMCYYIVIFLSISTALGRWGRIISNEVRAAHVRVVTFLILMAGVMFPFLPRMMKYVTTFRFSFVDLTNPFVVLENLYTGSAPVTDVLFVLLVIATFSLLVSLRAMYDGTTDILRGKMTNGRSKRGQVHFSD